MGLSVDDAPPIAPLAGDEIASNARAQAARKVPTADYRGLNIRIKADIQQWSFLLLQRPPLRQPALVLLVALMIPLILVIDFTGTGFIIKATTRV